MKLFTPHWGSTSVKLADLLKSQEKQDLVYSAYSLHLSVSEKLKTNDFAETLAKEVLTSANKWVGGLPQYDLIFLSKLVDAGPNNFVEEPNLLPVSMLQLSSIIICEECSDEKECRRFMICDELREAVAPYVHAELHSEENVQRFVFEKYVLYNQKDEFDLKFAINLLKARSEGLDKEKKLRAIKFKELYLPLESNHWTQITDDLILYNTRTKRFIQVMIDSYGNFTFVQHVISPKSNYKHQIDVARLPIMQKFYISENYIYSRCVELNFEHMFAILETCIKIG